MSKGSFPTRNLSEKFRDNYDGIVWRHKEWPHAELPKPILKPNLPTQAELAKAWEEHQKRNN